MTYHPVVEKIKDLLTQRGAWFETFEHAPVRTSEEAAKVRTGGEGYYCSGQRKRTKEVCDVCHACPSAI